VSTNPENDKPARPPHLWVVAGATGTGKSELALDLAQALIARGTPAEVVNADAMQLYRGMDIGTAKLRPEERRGIPHHLFDVRDVGEEAAVAWYQPLARAAVESIHGRGSDAILVGGSGLYVSSVIFDFRFPPRDEELRGRLEDELARDGLDALLQRLLALDPETAARVDPRNSRRVLRALEVLEQGSATHGAALPSEPLLWHPQTHLIGLHVDREQLVHRLDERVEQMWRSGLVDEVEALRAAGLEMGATARRAIGYAQALGQLEGTLTRAQAIAQTQALTRRYARRQVSWFKRYRDIVWHQPPVDAASLLADIDAAAT
jgi:tRNA dimethylallyltransferase